MSKRTGEACKGAAADDKRRKLQSYSIEFKLEAISYVKQGNSKESTSRVFGVDSKRIREWCKQEDKLMSMKAKARKRLDGGGRKPLYQTLKTKFYQWIKVAQQKEKEELRNLAFGRVGKPHSSGGGSSQRDKQPKNEQHPEDKQWKEWQEADQEFVSESYERDLQQALMLSKLEAEEQKRAQSATKENDSSTSQKKAKKKKDKPITMSLEEFQQDDSKKETGTHNGSTDTQDIEADPTFFKNVEEETHKIIRKEQIQEEYRKQYIVESARTQKYKETIQKKSEEIEHLKKENAILKAELKEVKERNQQLCMILAQGEMKAKTTVIMELNQLKQVRDELTQEVANLTSELEKERSKVHALKTSMDKSKSGKRK